MKTETTLETKAMEQDKERVSSPETARGTKEIPTATHSTLRYY